jgi:hypothetical protein
VLRRVVEGQTFSKNRSAFGTSGSVSPTIECNISEDVNLQERRCENPRSITYMIALRDVTLNHSRDDIQADI